MPQLGFQARFADSVARGFKRTTIRRDRAVPIKQGDRLYLWTGLRTPGARKLGEGICTQVRPIEIRCDVIILSGCPISKGFRNQIARDDGFPEGFRQMWDEWFSRYAPRFVGIWHEWDLVPRAQWERIVPDTRIWEAAAK